MCAVIKKAIMDMFSQSLVVPSNLRFFLHRLAENAQPSTNILRVNTLNNTSCSSGGLILVRLPMALCDLNTFAMHFETNVTPGSTSLGVRPVFNTQSSQVYDNGFLGILPKGIEGCIARVEVAVNGLGLLNLQRYNLLFNALKESHLHLDKCLSRTQLQNEKDTAPLIASSAYTNGAGLTSSSELITIHVSNWQVSVSSVQEDISEFSIICTTTTSEPLPGTFNNTSLYEVPWFPQLPFLAGRPVVSGGPGGACLTYYPKIDWVNTTAQAYQTSGANGASPQTATYVTQFQLSYNISNETNTIVLPPVGTKSTPAQSFTIFVSQKQPENEVNNNPIVPALMVNNNNYHSITDWLGFFHAQPSWIQTQMLGEIEVRITLAGNDVLGITHPQLPTGNQEKTLALESSHDPALYGWQPVSRPDFSFQNIFFSIRTCSFDNNFLDDILHHKLSGGGELEVPYMNFFNITQNQNGGSTQTRFSVNTQCLDKVLALNRVPNYNSIQNMLNQIPCGMGATTSDRLGMVHKSPYFSTYASYPSGFNYSAQNPQQEPSKNNGYVGAFNQWQMQINNSFVPNYKISPVNNFFFNQEAYGMHNDWASGTVSTTPSVYLNSCYQMVVALDFQDPSVERLLSGVDSRGAVSVCYLNQDQQYPNETTDIFTCFTSVLRIGANQQIQVVY